MIYTVEITPKRRDLSIYVNNKVQSQVLVHVAAQAQDQSWGREWESLPIQVKKAITEQLREQIIGNPSLSL